MGQKVNPHGLRVGVIKDWDSKWYAEKDFADNLVEDHEIRTFLKKRLYSAGISRIEIESASDRVKIIVYTAKPGVVIGKGGSEIEKVKAELAKYTDKKLIVDIKEIKRPDKDAQLVAAEKHYLKAVVSLRIDSSFQGCQNAVTELHKAIKLDPTNEAYTALLDAISEQIKDYEQRQRDKAAQDERERQERERRSQQALADAQRRQFWNSAGPCLGGLASIGVTILACWCGCECCKSGCGC